MSLPVLHVPGHRSDSDLLRLFCRIELLQSDSIAEQAPLQAGTALTNPQFPNIAVANRMLDAKIAAGVSAEQTLEEVAKHFASLGVSCREWRPQSGDKSLPLADALASVGFVRRAIEVHVLRAPTRPPVEPRSDLSVYSARAGLRHARSLMDEMTGEVPFAEQAIEAMLQRLDDPHYELLLAAEDGQTVGSVGIFAAGDIGRVDALFVRASHRRRGVGRQLLARAVELCVRSRFADVLTSFSDAQLPARPVFAEYGFTRVNSLQVYSL